MCEDLWRMADASTFAYNEFEIVGKCIGNFESLLSLFLSFRRKVNRKINNRKSSYRFYNSITFTKHIYLCSNNFLNDVHGLICFTVM